MKIKNNWLYYLLNNYKISAYKLSTYSSIPHSTLTSIMYNNTHWKNVKFNIIVNIADYLNMSLNDLYHILKTYDYHLSS